MVLLETGGPATAAAAAAHHFGRSVGVAAVTAAHHTVAVAQSESGRTVLPESKSLIQGLVDYEYFSKQRSLAEIVQHALLEPHPSFKLFAYEDLWSWVLFTVLFIALVIFDNCWLMRNHRVLTFKQACSYMLFWVGCAVAFNVWIFARYGGDSAYQWATGYLLEWMLSVDNLFVFHMVFDMYGCPDQLKHKPLFWGIVGAVVFRILAFGNLGICFRAFVGIWILEIWAFVFTRVWPFL